MRKFTKRSWKRINKNFRCHFAEHPDDEEAKTAQHTIRKLLMARSKFMSVYCHLTLLQNRTTYSHVFLTREGDQVAEDCEIQIIEAKRQVLELHELLASEDGEMTVEGWMRVPQRISEFFMDWDGVADELYDGKLNSGKRSRILDELTEDAAKLFHSYTAEGLKALDMVDPEDPAYDLALEIMNASLLLEDTCIDELRYIDLSLKPFMRLP